MPSRYMTNWVSHALLGISATWMGSDELFLLLGCHHKPPGLPCITAPWFLEVGHVTISGNQWDPSPMLNWGTVITLTKSVYGRHLIYGNPVWGRLRKERRRTAVQWSLAARHCLFRMGPRYRRRTCSVNRLRWLRMVCVNIRALWRPGFLQYFLWMVSIVGTHEDTGIPEH